MRRRFGQALRVGVTEGTVALALTSRRGEPRVLGEVAYDPAQAGALLSALAQLLDSAYARWPVSFVVANDLARMWRVTPPNDASRMADLEAAAALRFHSLFGEMPTQWAIRASWDAVRPFMAAATPHALLAAVTQAAGAQRMPVTGIEPHFVVALNAARPALRKGGWFALVHEDVITVGAANDSSLESIRSTAVPAGAGPDWLASHVAREAMLLGVQEPHALALAGAVPGSWLGGTPKLACALTGPQPNPAWTSAAQLALAGVAG